MGSLSGCIAKAGALLSAKDRATLNEAALKMRAAGGDRVEAEKTAVAQVIEALRKAEPKEATKAGVAFDPRRVFGQPRISTDTPEFKAWFGDSKVVDAQGKPLVVYHGTDADIASFSPAKRGAATGAKSAAAGFWFVDRADVASSYANHAALDAPVRRLIEAADKAEKRGDFDGYDARIAEAEALEADSNTMRGQNLVPAFLALKNPASFDAKGELFTTVADELNAAIAKAKRQGKDGMIVTNVDDDPRFSDRVGTHYLVFKPEQIKSVFNRGTFDPNDPNILNQAAYHGSPYRFTKFTLDHLGKGEGTQVFGHGLYFASLKDVAEFYRGLATAKTGDRGQTYKVEIPEDTVLLDRNAPVSKQPDAVRAALEKLGFPAERFRVTEGKAAGVYDTIEQARAALKSSGQAGAIKREPSKITGADAYNALSKKLGSDKAASEALLDAGVLGLKYLDAHSRASVSEGRSHNYVIFRGEDVEIRDMLYQGESGPLGGYDPTSRTMIFTPRSNLSTALHESAHHFLELSRAFASAPDAPAQIKADFDILLRTYGVKGDTPEARLADWNGRDLEAQRAVHERFATEFERYLFEGKAPTQSLQPLFSRFRTWMVALYQRLMGSPQGLPDLSPEVKGVMDRMLASEAAIKEAEASRAYLPIPKEAFGDDKAYQEYLDLGLRATERAVDEMTQRSIKDMQWESGAKTKALKQLQAKHNAARKAISEQVEAEWAESPAVRAEAALRDAHAQGRVEPGVDETIALASGFRDADDMYAAVGAIRERGGVAAAREDFVRAETDRRMLIEHGDLVDPKAIDEAANAAVHNGARARFLATGLKVLTKSPVPVSELVRAAKETAAGMIGERKIGDLRVDTYLAAERRANKEVLAKVAKDPAAAIEAQRQAMLANRLAKTALDARAEVDKGLAYLKKMADGPDSIAIDARDQITAILERFQLGGTRKRADTMRTLAQWIEGQKELGLEPDIPPEIMAEAFRTNYRDLTVDQFRGLVDSIKQIEHLGRLENRLLTARRSETFAQARDAMVEGVVANAAGREAEVRSSNTVTGRALEGMKDFWASHITAAMFARRFDGGKDGGVVWEHLIRPANERGHWEVEMRAKATRDLVDIMKPVFDLGRMGGAGEMFPTIGRKLNRQARLAFALNAGNEGNLQRLLDGNGYTREQIQPVLESLTAAEWKAVQGVWDYMETFRPLIAAKERRVMGREPEWVEPTPFTVKTADGQTLQMKGGYYPIKYDPRASARAETHQLAEDIAQQMRGAYTSATTRRSFTKARVDEVHNRPLLESLDGIYSGVQDVIHDLAWHEFLVDANRLMRDESLSQTIRSTWGPEAHQQLRTWLTDVASGEAAARQAGERAVSWVRQGVSIAGLGFNVMNAMLQPLGFTQSISRIGPKWVGRGVAKALGSPMETAGQISDMSPFMRTRFLTRFRELNELRNVVQGQSKVRTALDTGAYALMLRFQQLVDIPTWWGAYEKAIAEGSDQSRAAALADQAVIDSQGSGMIKDMPSVMRGGQFQKLFTSFYAFFNTTFNLATERTASSQSKADLAAQYLLLFALPATMAAALKDALTPGESDDWSEEKLARKLLGENLGYLLNSMFLVRELGNPVSQSVKGEPFGTDYSGPAGLRMIGDASKVISKITKPNEVEWNDSLRKAVVNLAGDLARLPAAQINRSITGVQALREGKTSNPMAVLFGYQEPK